MALALCDRHLPSDRTSPGLIDPSERNIETPFQTWKRRWWSTDVDFFASKGHFLRYAGRYVRRPPVAQYRFLSLDSEEVTFWTNDLKLKRRVVARSSALREGLRT